MLLVGRWLNIKNRSEYYFKSNSFPLSVSNAYYISLTKTTMNKELKEQAHKEFDEKFLGMATDFFIVKQGFINSSEEQLKYIDVRNFIDSLIDKTVQHEQERIVGIVIKYIRSGEVSGSFSSCCDCSDCDKYEKKVRKDLKSLINNKSDINN